MTTDCNADTCWVCPRCNQVVCGNEHVCPGTVVTTYPMSAPDYTALLKRIAATLERIEQWLRES
jgi:hypothetical protein